jgi:outer membrane protein insertion porin family
MAPSEKASFAVREEAGHSLKSSFSHTATVDRRDHAGMGSLFTLENQAAGFGGDCHFLKHTAGVTHRKDIGAGCVLRLSCRGGVLDPLPAGKIMRTLAPTSGPALGPVIRPRLVDRFFLGGCTDVRGFAARGIGPREREDALGGDAFLAAAAHLYTPMPLERLREVNDNIKLHFFANGGSCIQVPPGLSAANQGQSLLSGMAVAVGAGLAVQMTDTIDLELNYCVPVL